MRRSSRTAGLRGFWAWVCVIAACSAGFLVALVSEAGRFSLAGVSASLLPGSQPAAQLDRLAAVALPTLGEWGMLAATLSLLAAGTSVIVRRRRR
jgi:hypothetical protein